ncbi:MotA/TolQ/ExbB proton channel family protein [Imhoffiella purpurea]|uniref:Ferric siderophore transport system, biopolymer transport protein ExbB n=1 Tax=Imhoffiella purpurea TaxID=1249627 RepID=W9VF95_9GAMM|nr:MotA/TolQ/ExbB proton channel family protein [Imhoffiella purpurea]EXJ15676.1 Ferric siderophore transport system, biopolymer transport protein ExbB [Imhoffiella purpurea]
MTEASIYAAPPESSQEDDPDTPLGVPAADGAAPSSAGSADPSTAPAVETDWLGSLAELPQRLDAFLDTGGPVVLVLGLLSVVALAIVILKLWQFQRLRLGSLGPARAAIGHWRRHDARAALAAVTGQRDPVSRVTHAALEGCRRPGADQSLLREELVRLATQELERLRGYLRALEVIGTLSPLLGLLGTVLGMIEAFRRLESAGSQVDPAILSGGIWQALLTTAVGLTVAIPAVLAHSWLERRVERCGHQMEDAVTQVFTRDLVMAEPEPVHETVPDDRLQVGHAA